MVKASWGIKRICRKCNASFYDLKKDPIECPKCLSTFTENDFMSKYAKTSEGREKRDSKKVALLEDVVSIDDVTLDEESLGDDSDLAQDVGGGY